MDPDGRCTPGLAAYQSLMEMDRPMRLANQDRLRDLANSGNGVRIFCSHDPIELEALQRLSSGVVPQAGAGHRPARTSSGRGEAALPRSV
jgi:hypothetical protein